MPTLSSSGGELPAPAESLSTEFNIVTDSEGMKLSDAIPPAEEEFTPYMHAVL